MSGKGKSGKQAAKHGAKKHTDLKAQESKGSHLPSQITIGALRRLARRGGVKRISAGSYPGARAFVDDFLEKMVKDSATYAEHANRQTINAMDVVYSLKRIGRAIYGYGV